MITCNAFRWLNTIDPAQVGPVNRLLVKEHWHTCSHCQEWLAFCLSRGWNVKEGQRGMLPAKEQFEADLAAVKKMGLVREDH